MGRAACHTGQTVTWDQIMKSRFQFCDYLDDLSYDAPVPVRAFPLTLVFLGPIIVNVYARSRGDDYPNLALGKESYMVRLQDNLPPASNGNDGNLATAVRSTPRTIDAYWEVDLGQEYAVDRVRVIPDSGFEDRMTHTVVRLFDGEHTSVYSRHMDSIPRQIFDVWCGGPRRARYVRVGLENKERSTPAGASSWDTYIGIKEVEVFGKESAEIGLFSFEASSSRISSGESVTFNWAVADITELKLYPDPNIDLLHSLTDVLGVGSITVFPEQSTEYLLVAENTFGVYVKAASVIVDDVPLSVCINEIMARNRQTLKDGYGDYSDWIEIHNPSDIEVEMAGCGLSDKPDNPMKWIFPDVKIPPHGYLIVFASGDKELDEPNDPEGYLHTNWKLDANGETVVLTAPDGVTVLDAIVNYPAQRADLAYGRDMQAGMALLEARISMHLSARGTLSPENNAARLAMRMEEIQDSLIAECARWGYQTPQSWINAAENIYNNLFPDRTAQLLGYLRAKGWYSAR